MVGMNFIDKSTISIRAGNNRRKFVWMLENEIEIENYSDFHHKFSNSIMN